MPRMLLYLIRENKSEYYWKKERNIEVMKVYRQIRCREEKQIAGWGGKYKWWKKVLIWSREREEIWCDYYVWETGIGWKIIYKGTKKENKGINEGWWRWEAKTKKRRWDTKEEEKESKRKKK